MPRLLLILILWKHRNISSILTNVTFIFCFLRHFLQPLALYDLPYFKTTTCRVKCLCPDQFSPFSINVFYLNAFSSLLILLL